MSRPEVFTVNKPIIIPGVNKKNEAFGLYGWSLGSDMADIFINITIRPDQTGSSTHPLLAFIM
jgi:hypothetical protein